MNGARLDRAQFANGRALWGIGLVLIGFVLFVDRLGLVDAERVLRFWPLLLVAFGLQQMLWPHARARTGAGILRVNGLVWTVIGGLLLLSGLGILHVSLWQLIWPTLLIFVGAHLMLRSRHHGSPSGEQGDDTAIVAILSGVQRVANAVAFNGTEITGVMGGVQLDLRRTQLARGEEAVVDVLLILGGCELFVPPEWVVSAPLIAILGGVDDQRLVAPASIVDAAVDRLAPPPRLVLRGFVMLGGITVR